MSVGTEIVAFIEAIPLTPVFLNYVPPMLPDVCICVMEYGGTPTVGGFGTVGVKYETVGIQIQVRGVKDDHDGPRAMINTAWRKLAEIQGTTLGATKYIWAQAIQSPMPLAVDERGRRLFVVSFHIEKEPS